MEGTPEFTAYLDDMLGAQAYALENRKLMMTAALADLFDFVGKGRELRRINRHHNFTAQEVHSGQRRWITRKGAIRDRKGDAGVIPGSIGTRSYIVEGLGNPDSYNSASHGAGRRMSRGQAKRDLSEESLTAMMDKIAWTRDAKSLLDEHPLAYKDIDQVMADQEDPCRATHTLHQIVNYKGG